VTLNAALVAFNDLRLASFPDERLAAMGERLAHACFRAAEHLIVYGSLSPGRPNHGRLAALGGAWSRGWVEGVREPVGWGAELGFPAVRWQPDGPRVEAFLLRSASLRDQWAALDRFEGPAYQRILAPFFTDQGLEAVGFLYAAAPATSHR
jgi:gamma-glutamylcyclotransferase (GGCT)/AIG2-like uncharacterized protein YtfP